MGLKGQTTIEYLLLISVVVLIFIGVLVTVNSLRQSTQGTVNVSGKEETPSQAIATQLANLRDIAGAAAQPPAPQNGTNQSQGGPITIDTALSCGCSSGGILIPDTPAIINVTLKNGAGQTIDGKVTQLDQSGAAINSGTTTSGMYLFCGLGSTPYTLKAEATGYNTTTKQLTTSAC